MIEEITLSNWKSFKQSKLYIEPLTFIIGYNASGKSNILDAMTFLSRIATGMTLADAAKEVRGGDSWVIKQGERDATLAVKVYEQDKSTYYDYQISFDSECRIIDEFLTRTIVQGKRRYNKDLFKLSRNSGDTDLSLNLSVYTGKQGRKNVNVDRRKSVLYQLSMTTVQKEVTDGVNCVQDRLRNMFVLDPIPNLMRDYSTLEVELKRDASNIAGVIAGLADNERTTVERRIAEKVRPLPERDIMEVRTETVGMFRKDAMLYCKELWVDGQEGMLLDARGMSDGTLRFIAIVTALLLLPKGTLLLIEEVDNGLHPSRAKELVSALKELGEERGIDVLCTTHNPYLIDAWGNEMISNISYVRRNTQTGASEIRLLDEHENLLTLMASGSIGASMAEGRI